MIHTGLTEVDPAVSSGAVWKYYHRAVSDVPGTARFTKQSRKPATGAGFGPGFEGGKINHAPTSENMDTTEEVQVITIDGFLQSEAKASGKVYPSLSSASGVTDEPFHVDILKVDAEGNDNKVLAGAKLALESTVALFTFEGGGGVSFSKEQIDDLDFRLGYSCYSTSRAGMCVD